MVVGSKVEVEATCRFYGHNAVDMAKVAHVTC